MKVLFVNASLTSGGSEKVMTILANEFARNNHKVSMILLRSKEKETYSLNSSIDCLRLKYKHSNKILKAIEKLLYIRKIVKKGNYDYIISFMHEINTQVLLSTIGLDTPVIISERADPSARKMNKFSKFIENKAYKRAKKIVLQTELVKKQYSKELQEKSVVIPNPISDNILEQYKGVRKKKIVAAGRLTSQKNFTLLLDAFKCILLKHSDYNLYIYGEGPLEKELKEYTKKLKIEDKVFFPGYVENVNECMNDAKIYVSTSNYEGISNSMLEALAMGIPTICTDCPVGGAAMVINSYENGILIPLGDKEKLVSSMLELIENNELSKKLSNNAIKVKENYNIDRIYEQWIKILE